MNAKILGLALILVSMMAVPVFAVDTVYADLYNNMSSWNTGNGLILLQYKYRANSTVANMTNQSSANASSQCGSGDQLWGQQDGSYLPLMNPKMCHFPTPYGANGINTTHIIDESYAAGATAQQVYTVIVPYDGDYRMRGDAQCMGGAFCGGGNGVLFSFIKRPILNQAVINATTTVGTLTVSGTSNYTFDMNFTNMKAGQAISIVTDNNGDEFYDIVGLYFFVTSNATAPNAPPQALNPVSNSTGANTTTRYNVTWTDDSALANYTFSFDNGTGTFVNDSIVPFTGTTNVSEAMKLTNQTAGSTIRWQFYACDNLGACNASPIQTYTARDLTIPAYTLVNVNTTIIGQLAKFSAKWENYGMRNATFEYDNGNGTLYNETISLTGATNFSNFTRILNGTPGATIRYRFWGVDIEGQINGTPQFSFLTTDPYAPQYTLIARNTSAAGYPVLFNTTWADNYALANYTFSFDNNTGTFVNDSTVPFTGTDNQSTATKIISAVPGTIRYIFYARDGVGNINDTGIRTFQSFDADAPQYTVYTQNQSGAGHTALFSVLWNNLNLSNYTFEFDNGNGTLQNTTGALAGTAAFANVTRLLTSIVGATVRYRFWGSDAEGNLNSTPQITFATTDIDAPTFGTATQNTTVAGQAVLFCITTNDNYNLTNYTFEIDNGNGTHYNVTGLATGTSAPICVQSVLDGVGNPAHFTAWSQDAYGNMAANYNMFTVSSPTPIPSYLKYGNIDNGEGIGESFMVVLKGGAQYTAHVIDVSDNGDNFALGALIVTLGIVIVGAYAIRHKW